MNEVAEKQYSGSCAKVSSRVLITGADGFVGKALCAEMVSRGWKVRASIRSLEKIKSLPQEIQIIETGSIGPDTEWTHALDAEKKLKEIARETGMETVIIRAPMVYGPEVKANFLKLLKAVDRGIPMPLTGIKNKRSMNLSWESC